MPPPLRKAGRAVTLPGLQMIMSVFAGFVFLVVIAAFFINGHVNQVDATFQSPLLAALGMLAVAEVLVLWFLRFRLKKDWQAELQAQPYNSGGILPSSYVMAVLLGGAMTQGLGLFGSVVYVMTGAAPAIVLSLLTIAFLIAQIPREDAFLKLIQLPPSQRSQ